MVAADAHEVSRIFFVLMHVLMFQVRYTTLCDQINRRLSRQETHQAQQQLPKPTEVTLHDWIGFHALSAKPLDMQGVCLLASDLSGSQPGKNWISRFMARHPDVCYSKPGSLDPKQAQNFNPSNIAGFYKLLKAIYDMYPDLPPQHIWNMDKKGLQLGGG